MNATRHGSNSNQYAQSLSGIETRAWHSIAVATIDSNHPFRNLTLATIDSGGHPQARIVVLRSANTEQQTLEFHTDTRSAKWNQLTEHPTVTVLGYNSSDRLQIRLTGTTRLFQSHSIENQRSWDSLSTWARHGYCAGPPGEEILAPAPAQLGTDAPAETEIEHGRKNFGVIRFKAEMLDCFLHNRGNLIRAICSYQVDGSSKKLSWINP